MKDAEQLIKRFIRLYANVDNLSSDVREIRLFGLWLEAAGIYMPEHFNDIQLRRKAELIKDDER